MVLRRRNTLPPYEVMGAAARKQAGHAPHPHPPSTTPEPGVVSRAPVSAPATAPGEGGSFWSRTTTPILLRIPRGLVIVGIVALLALVAMAYWVGRSRGETQERKRNEDLTQEGERFIGEVTRAQTQNNSTPPKQVPTTPNNTRTPNNTGGQSTGGSHTVVSAQRQPGYQYFLLMTTNKEGAEDLVKFLKDNQVEAGAFLSNNGRFYEVYALRGFPPDMVASKERADYEAQLRNVGRAWKANRRGATDLHDMSPRLYKGETKSP